ncbi:carboxylesterase family protein [Caldimonas sp.]|uniref:carboxylesterase/lipase family protein n=1 Tax=Caldimonas sp. TaxID=2838790 RepID=UPI00307FB07B
MMTQDTAMYRQLSLVRRHMRGCCTVVLMLTLAACGGGDRPTAPPDPTQALTSAGAVRGQLDGNRSMVQFKGIPYAAAPVGALRWRPPQPPTPWTGERPATNFGPACAQPASAFGTSEPTVNEDCLTLNVFRPTAPGPHPVMVWIHGGAFYLGTSAGYPDVSSLVAQQVVVVTLNYRLGALGFMAHPALSAEQGGHSGNYGLMDQQAALRWVRDNIAAFGGDPRNVTIFGESAGGFSVLSHLVAPASAGLFHKAIVMSGAYGLDLQDTLSLSEDKGRSLAQTAMGLVTGAGGPACDTSTVECLRSLPVQALLGAQMTVYPRGPVPSVDGRVLDASVRQKIWAGTHHAVPVMQGSTRDEYRLFAALNELGGAAPLTHSTLSAAIQGLGLPAPLADALAATPYHPSRYEDNASFAFAAVGTDLVFACNGLNVSRRLASRGHAVYAYEFRDRSAPEVLPAVSFPQGAAHSAELQYLFDMPRPLDAAQTSLKQAIVRYVTRFARDGRPDVPGLPAWPAFRSEAPIYMGLDLASGEGIAPHAQFAAEHQCDTVWSSLNDD